MYVFTALFGQVVPLRAGLFVGFDDWYCFEAAGVALALRSVSSC